MHNCVLSVHVYVFEDHQALWAGRASRIPCLRTTGHTHTVGRTAAAASKMTAPSPSPTARSTTTPQWWAVAFTTPRTLHSTACTPPTRPSASTRRTTACSWTCTEPRVPARRRCRRARRRRRAPRRCCEHARPLRGRSENRATPRPLSVLSTLQRVTQGSLRAPPGVLLLGSAIRAQMPLSG